MAFLNKLKAVVQAEGARGIRQVLQKEGTKRFAQDLSATLSLETMDFCETRRYGLPALISAVAVDPVQGLLATGTFKGVIAILGATETTCYLELEEAVSIKMLAFQPGAPVLVAIDAKNAITVFDLIKKQRLFVRNARSVVTCMELLPGSNWLFHGLKDGCVDVFDVYRGQAVPYRIPNLIPEGNRHSMVVAIQAHPKDNNQLLIAYNTGVALWNLKLKEIIRVFIYAIPPGAMGGISAVDGMFGANESRFPHVTVVAWRPDGHGVVVGYEDGCLAFFDLKVEPPVMARTIHEVNVNIPGMKRVVERETTHFVPIYQIAWCLHSNKEDTTLIVAGGTSSLDMYGLHVFEFSAKSDYKNPKRQHTLTTESDILDFVILPRESPWYNSALDPVAILILTNKGGIQTFGFDAPHTQHINPSCLQLVEPKLILSKIYSQMSPYHYNRLVNGLHQNRPRLEARLPLKGALVAYADESRIKRDILITAHADASIRFWEGASFRPLHHLTVELASIVAKQGQIVAFDYSVHSRTLCVGFSNGNWAYLPLADESQLSRQSSVATSVAPLPEDSAAGQMTESLATVSINAEKGSPILASPVNETQPKPEQVLNQPQVEPQSPRQPTQQDPALFQGPAPQPRDTKVVQSLKVQDQSEATQTPTVTTAPPPRADTKDTLPMPTPEELDYLVPVTPVDSVPPLRNPLDGDQKLSSPPPMPPREPSPALPPRPPFVESRLHNGSEFPSAFVANAHLGRINKFALSDCGLIAVSDEFYTLSITDTYSGKTIHTEDLKDREKPQSHNAQESESNTQNAHQQQVSGRGGAAGSNNQKQETRGQDQSLQRVGVVLTTLQFVISTTSDQDKVPSLLLVAGSDNGIYMIFAISPLSSTPGQQQARTVRKVETFQTKEQLPSVHTSVINVISASPENASMSATSLSSMSTATSTATASSLPSPIQQAPAHHGGGSEDAPLPALPQGPQALSGVGQPSEGEHLARKEHGTPLPDSTVSSPSSPSSTTSNPATAATSNAHQNSKSPSIYSTLREAQAMVMSKAQQRLNYLVCISERGIRLHMNCTSRRIHKVDLTADLANDLQLLREAGAPLGPNSTNRIMAANVVYHEGACCILCITEVGRILLFSVPKLELIPIPATATLSASHAQRLGAGATTELRLPIVAEPQRLGETTILPDGRMLVPILKYEFRLYGLWGHDRWIRHPTSGEWVQDRDSVTGAAHTSVRLYDHTIQIPPRPTPTVSRSWLFGSSENEVPSQEDLDALLGGEHYVAENPILKQAGVHGPPGSLPPVPSKQGGAAGGGASSGIAGVMNETALALDERGKKLGELGTRTQEMQEASNDFLRAARELNAKNANKKWYEF